MELYAPKGSSRNNRFIRLTWYLALIALNAIREYIVEKGMLYVGIYWERSSIVALIVMLTHPLDMHRNTSQTLYCYISLYLSISQI